MSVLSRIGETIGNLLNKKVDKIMSTDNAIAIFDGTTGDIQDSGVIVDDIGDIMTTVNGDIHKLSEKTNQADFERYFKFQNWKNIISGGGNITWSNNKLSTSQGLILIPTNARNGFININLTNLSVPSWRIVYIDLTDSQLIRSSLTQDNFTVENFNSYTEATSQNRFVLGYCNGDTNEFIFSNGLSVDNMNYNEDKITSKVSKVTSTDNAIARFDGTTGDLQDSNVIVDDSGDITTTINGDIHKLSEKTNQDDFERYFKFQNWKNTISGGGNITWSGNNLSTSQRLIVIPTNASGGYISINLNNLRVPGWNIAYIDLTDAQLRQPNLLLTQDDFTVDGYTSYTEATSQNRFVLGYCNKDTNEFIFSNGLTVDNMNYKDSGWIDATYQNGWTTYGGAYSQARYKKIGSVVYIDGLVKAGTIGQAVFTLPSGFRPTKRQLKATETDRNANGRLDINTNGDVVASSGSSGWFSVNCSFAL